MLARLSAALFGAALFAGAASAEDTTIKFKLGWTTQGSDAGCGSEHRLGRLLTRPQRGVHRAVLDRFGRFAGHLCRNEGPGARGEPRTDCRCGRIGGLTRAFAKCALQAYFALHQATASRLSNEVDRWTATT